MKTIKKISIIMAWLIVIPALCNAQRINFDKLVRAGELILFQEVDNPNNYYYISDKPKLGKGTDGKPQFSFMRYVQNVASAVDQPETNEAEGGGIVHAVIALEVSPEQIQKASQEMRRVAPGGTIKGPVIYTGGTIALISSVANPEGGFAKKVIGLGKAPIMDGQKAAISVSLTKEGAKILWESFKTPTPDMSISFEMGLTGYRSPKRAVIEANFDQIYEHQTMQAAIAMPVLAAEIKASFEDLVKKGSIKVTQIGEDAKMEQLLEAAYTKLISMMFDPVGGTGTPSLSSLTSTTTTQPSMLDRATTMLNTARTEARNENQRRDSEAARADYSNSLTRGTGTDTSSRSALIPTEVPPQNADRVEARQQNRANQPDRERVAEPSLAIAASYELKRVHQRGEFTIDLNKYTADNLTVRFDENFGQINCTECFREINLDDPLYKQREIVAFLDGANSSDFGSYINFVTLSMRKKHQNNDLTLDEIRIDKNNFNKTGNNFKMLYGWKGDNNRAKWFDYEYKTAWSFFGGTLVETDWQPYTSAALSLSAPYIRKQISIESDPDVLKEKNVRMIEIKLYYKINNEERITDATMNIAKGDFSKVLDVIQPLNTIDYDYEITCFIKGGGQKITGRKKSSSTVLFIDEIVTL